MRFLANENFPFPGIVLLREKGLSVKSILEESPGISDIEVVHIAIAEELIILTFDKDYGEILFKYAINILKPSVVYFKEKHQTKLASAHSLLSLIQEGITLKGRFTVVEENSCRQRVY